jgi:hypothetical protein
MALASLPSVFAQGPVVFWSPATVPFSVNAGTSGVISATARLTNTTANAFNFLAASNQGWLSINPLSGTIDGSTSRDFLVSVDVSQLQSGNYSGIVLLTPSPFSGIAPVPLYVTLSVNGLALLLNPSTLTYSVGADSQDLKTFTVSVSDGLPHQVNVTTTGGSWLSVSNSLPVTTPASIKVVVNTAGSEIGSVLQGQVNLGVVGAGYESVTGTVPVTVNVIERPGGFTVVPNQLNYYVFGSIPPPSQPVLVQNTTGNQFMPFTVTKSDTTGYLTISSSGGLTPAAFSAQVDTTFTPELPRSDSITVQPGDGNLPVLVPVITEQQPPQVNAIQQVADGGPFKTQITLVNIGNVPIQTSLKFYRSDPATHQTSPWFPAIEGNANIDNVTIPVRCSYTVRTAGGGAEIVQGWAEVVTGTDPRQVVGGLAVFQQLQPDGRVQEAAVPIGNTLMQRNMLPFDNTNDYVTSMALVNLSNTTAATVRVAFLDPQGNIFKVDRLESIPARGHIAFELERKFPYLQGRKGTAQFWATTGQITLLGLEFNPTGSYTSFETQSLDQRLTGRASIPQVADGGLDATGQYITTFTLVNKDATPAHVQLKFYQDLGNGRSQPWNIQLAGGVDPNNIVIPVGTSVMIQTAGVPSTIQTGWAEVVTTQAVTGFAVFRLRVTGRPDQEAAVPVNIGTTVRSLLLPFDNTGIYTTSLALANISTSVASVVNLTFRDAQGLTIYQTSVDLPAQGHRAFSTMDLSATLREKKGTLEISQDISGIGELSVLGLRFANTGAFTSYKAQVVQP